MLDKGQRYMGPTPGWPLSRPDALYEAPSHRLDEAMLIRDVSNTLAGLLATAAVALDKDTHAAQTCIRHAAALLGIDLIPAAATGTERSFPKGGLAPWQAKRINTYIEGNLGANIRATDLAAVVQLSTSHFFRAFRESFGEPPLAYIMRRRIHRAQQLMLASRRALLQIAIECGISNQAHFSRVFRRVVGINPVAWRRQFLISPHEWTSFGCAVQALEGSFRAQ